MGGFILRRTAYMLLTLMAVSVVSFVIIQLPPGDFLTSYITQLSAGGTVVEQDLIDSLKKQYGLDQPVYVQYFKWVGSLLQGDLGWSFAWNKPVSELIGERMLLTVVLSLATMVFTYVTAISIGIISATKQYSIMDYVFTVLGFLGLAVPNFLLALLLMFFLSKYFGISVGGLFSMQYLDAPWSWGKFVDLMNHMWTPIIVIGTAGTAGLIRVMRGCLLDELGKQYVETARAKGLTETRLLLKYPVRLAINPVISTIGWMLPAVVSGSTITAVVLSLPTTGGLLLSALLSQDMYLAGSTIMLLSSLTVIGTLISDILLVWVDPRIRLGGGH